MPEERIWINKQTRRDCLSDPPLSPYYISVSIWYNTLRSDICRASSKRISQLAVSWRNPIYVKKSHRVYKLSEIHLSIYISPHKEMTTGNCGASFGFVRVFSILRTTSIPSMTLPKTTCLLSRKGVGTVVMKTRGILMVWFGGEGWSRGRRGYANEMWEDEKTYIESHWYLDQHSISKLVSHPA